MKHILLFLIIVSPIQLNAQIAGTYVLIVDERAFSIRFEENQSFRYVPFSKSDFIGTGTFKQNADTLTLIFGAYADPEIEDCRGYEVSHESTYTHPDSINFQLQVFDCKTKELIPFCSIFIQPDEVYDSISYNSFNGFTYDRNISTGPDGKANFRLSTKMIGKSIRISSPEYNEVDVKIPANARSMSLDIDLLEDYDRTIVTAGTQQYLIKKEKRRYLRTRRLSNNFHGRKDVFFLPRGKNQDKIRFPRVIKKYYNISP
ncbi:MAG: hypothetical protein R8P61_20680 [Bacteroidia bacterium]|nr:hypothetical protein [Bacteroidia bacterium]